MKVSVKRNKANILLSLLLTTLVLSLCASLFACSEKQQRGYALLSPAINLLAEQSEMAKSALVGESIRFSAEDFERALNIASVRSITLTSLPPVTDGQLRVGSTVLTGEETLSAASLSLLTYHPSGSAVCSSSFKFKADGLPYEMTCRLYSLEEQNYAPTLALAPESALEVSTYTDVTCFGQINCYDPDGDETVIEIVRYPEKGILIMDDATLGAYRYVPYDNASGSDSFVCVAIDRYGNYSAAREVEIEIKRSSLSERYVDLVDSPHENSALVMTEKQIMNGTQVGSSLYFYPDREVSRAEFTVMAMSAIGVREPAEVSSTVFADDAEIPERMKPYVAAAYELGYISGSPDERGRLCFDPSRSITRAEAAVMLSDMLGAATPTVQMTVADGDEIPAWAESSVYAMLELGVLEVTETGASPFEKLTRGSASDILSRFMRYAEKK